MMTNGVNPVKDNQVEENIDPSNINPFTEEEMVAKWLDYATSIRTKQPRLSSVLSEHTPKLADNFTITYPTLNEKQKKHLIDYTQAFVTHLRKELQNDKILIEWVIEALSAEEIKSKAYTNDDKLRVLMQKNPAVEKLKRDLDLDFR